MNAWVAGRGYGVTQLTRLLWLVPLTVCLGGVVSAEAFNTGQDLVRACSRGDAAEQRLMDLTCAGYASGFVDAYRVSMVVMEHYAPHAEGPICLPAQGIENAHMMALVINRLERIPADRAASARVVVFETLKAAYPCQ